MRRTIFVISILALSFFIYAKDKKSELKTADFVDLNRSMGTWYEIARITHWFERGLIDVSATYRLLPNGDIEMVNSGHKGSLDGKFKTAKGRARIIDKISNSKLKASFFWPFWGRYWIIDVGKEYEYAVIGNPNLKYLWILSRTPDMREDLYQDILRRAQLQGFDTSRLEKRQMRSSEKK